VIAPAPAAAHARAMLAAECKERREETEREKGGETLLAIKRAHACEQPAAQSYQCS